MTTVLPEWPVPGSRTVDDGQDALRAIERRVLWLSMAMTEWKAVANLSRPVLEAASIEPEVGDILTARNDGQIAELAQALRDGVPTLSAPDAEVYASILLAPLAYYFQLFLRGRPFNERRVLDAMASAWMAIMADISPSAAEHPAVAD